MTKSKTGREKISTAERRRLALELRRSGLSFDRIGQQLGISRQAAHSHVTKALEKLAGEIDDRADELRAMELERLDRILLGCYQAAAGGNLKAIDRVIKISERRAKLLGLDAPSKIANTTKDGEDADGTGVFVVPAPAASIEDWVAQAQAYQQDKEPDE